LLSKLSLSLTGQLLALQLAIIGVVLVGVASVTIAQSTTRFRDTETRLAGRAAETVASTASVRAFAENGGSLSFLRSTAESQRVLSGASDVVITDEQLTVLATADPARMGKRLELHGSPVMEGRGWSGTVREQDTPTVVAHRPIMSERPGHVGEVIGVVAVYRDYPTFADGLREAAPNLLTYLGVATLVGVAGSLFIARRVRRQTFGLDPVEIAGLVEHRGAMLHGIREGVIGLDLTGRVTLVNDQAASLLGLPVDAVGKRVSELPLDARIREVLTQPGDTPDQVVPVDDRVLILNTLPISTRGLRIGSVTTLRDRTELLELQRELDVTKHTTDTLRAQAHEFSNRLHTISGLIELGDYGEVVQYVQRLDASVSRMAGEVATKVADPAVAALLLAKANQADERGVRFVIGSETNVGRLDEHLSADVATVVGNLVDNAFDAVIQSPGERVVQIDVVEAADEVTVTVRDSGHGVNADEVDQLFRRGFSTKGSDGERGIGLSLVRLVCRRRGGDVTAHNEDGAVFTARLPMRSKVGR
jgi:two-component system, CitB family, sensor kinase